MEKSKIKSYYQITVFLILRQLKILVIKMYIIILQTSTTAIKLYIVYFNTKLKQTTFMVKIIEYFADIVSYKCMVLILYSNITDTNKIDVDNSP